MAPLRHRLPSKSLLDETILRPYSGYELQPIRRSSPSTVSIPRSTLIAIVSVIAVLLLASFLALGILLHQRRRKSRSSDLKAQFSSPPATTASPLTSTATTTKTTKMKKMMMMRKKRNRGKAGAPCPNVRLHARVSRMAAEVDMQFRAQFSGCLVVAPENPFLVPRSPVEIGEDVRRSRRWELPSVPSVPSAAVVADGVGRGRKSLRFDERGLGTWVLKG